MWNTKGAILEHKQADKVAAWVLLEIAQPAITTRVLVKHKQYTHIIYIYYNVKRRESLAVVMLHENRTVTLAISERTSKMIDIEGKMEYHRSPIFSINFSPADSGTSEA